MRVVLVLLSALLFSNAWAEDWYAGAALGYGKANKSCDDATTNVYYSCDEHDTTYGLFVGRQLNRTFGIELGHTWLGKTETLGQVEIVNGERALPGPPSADQGLFPASSSWRAMGFELTGSIAFPVSANVDIYTKAGAFFWKSKYETSIPDGRPSYEDSGTNLTYGLGVRYQVIKTFSVRAQWQRYDDVDDFDINVFGVAALIHF